jgi:peptidoglycan hydrolase-like protein with peptidoglycan-binding domain
MGIISASVGRGGVNQIEDVRTIQDLLNKSSCAPDPALGVDGKMGPRTIAAIEVFQKQVVHLKHPDGRIDPGGKTLLALAEDSAEEPGAPASPPSPASAPGSTPVMAAPTAKPSTALPAVRGGVRLTEADFERAAGSLACEIACVKAVTEVEARGRGFYDSGRPKILFEAHIFSQRTQHKYDATHPDVSSLKWNKKLYKGGEKEYERLEKAMSLNRSAALQSASWGLFQIMGFNYQNAGFDSVDAYVEAMFESEGRQLDAFVNFIKAAKLDGHLRARRWARFAQGYNGPAYAENQYDKKLLAAYEKYRKKG